MLSNLPKGDWSSRREIGAPEGRLELPKGDWSPEGRLVSRREIGFPKGHLSMEYIYKYSVLGIGIALILSPVTAKGRVRSAD